MQLSAMDCNGRSSNHVERDSDLDDLSHGDRTTDDDMRDCDSLDGDNHQIGVGKRLAKRLNHSILSNGGNMYFNDTGSTGELSPNQQTEQPELRHHHQLPANHPLSTLGFMGIAGLHSIPSLQHNDVLEKLKMQVRDMKVGLMDQEYANAAFGAHVLPTTLNSSFTLPPPAIASFTAHSGPVGIVAAQQQQQQQQQQQHHHHQQQQQQQQSSNGNVACTNGATAYNSGSTGNAVNATANGASGGGAGVVVSAGAHNFSFTSPTAPNSKEVNSASNSSTSSEASNSSQQNNGWSFEEQYKQVRQLYEINDDPKRKEFLDDLFSFMQKRGTPINRLPIMAKSVLDLYELYNLVIARGGLVDVINKKLWQEIIKGLHLPSSITSAAFTLRTQYMKYLYPYECEKKNLSTPAELQAAIDGNRREGRRSSYGQYEAMHSQMPMGQLSRPPLPGGLQQISPLALVTHAAAANNQQAQARRLMGPGFAPMPNLVSQEMENRMMEYLSLLQGKKEQNVLTAGANAVLETSHQQRQRSQSPELTRDALSALKMSHVALWQMYHNNTSPPTANSAMEQQRSEALNLSDSPPNITIKREREREQSPEQNDNCHDHEQPPPSKRPVNAPLLPPTAFPANFYLNPHNMAAVAAAASLRHTNRNHHHNDHDDRQHENDANSDAEGDDDFGNGTTASSVHDESEQQQMNGHLDKSDDSAIENSPSTSSASGGGGGGGGTGGVGANVGGGGTAKRHSSPISTKNKNNAKEPKEEISAGSAAPVNLSSPLDALSLLSGLQFQVSRNGTNELTVNLELNGIRYAGILVADAANADLRNLDNIDKETSLNNSTSTLNTSIEQAQAEHGATIAVPPAIAAAAADVQSPQPANNIGLHDIDDDEPIPKDVAAAAAAAI